ncbi:MAG TPA: hypothetical protein VFQ53_03070 [Kofleriaceae bacterium]|nr:hypothetical protein [Kofleriaceae bacterium]
MRKLLVLALALPLVACVVGDEGSGGGGGGGDDGSGSGSGSGSGQAGHITESTTLSGTVNIDVATTIDPGVTVTVAAGTTINMSATSRLTVQGILDVQGTSASKVTIQSTNPAESFGGIQVPTGGEVRMAYVTQSGGGISTSGSGKVTIADSVFSNPSPTPSSRGDFFVMSGGTLTISYSEIGIATGDGTHCNFHFGGNGNTIDIQHSTIRGVPYGLMFYGGTNAILTSNNWQSDINVDTQPGVSGDLSNSYFEGGAPTPTAGATLTLNNLAAAPLADAKPR